MEGEIKYFGTETAYGHDGEPLSGDTILEASLRIGEDLLSDPVKTLVSDMFLISRRQIRYPVSYTHS